jgi:hypothetical protein
MIMYFLYFPFLSATIVIEKFLSLRFAMLVTAQLLFKKKYWEKWRSVNKLSTQLAAISGLMPVI